MASETMRITEELVIADKTDPGLSAADRKVSQFEKTLEKTQNKLKKMGSSRWAVRLEAMDKATQTITKVESKIRGIVGKAWRFTVGVIDKVTAPLQSIFRMLSNPLLQAGVILGVSFSLKDVVDTFGGFESTMSKVKAISGASAQDMQGLTDLAKQMGSTTKFTAEEAAQGLTYMAMAGWKTEDMMSSLSGVMNLAAASGEDLATVSDIVTDAMTAFGLSASGTTKDGVANATHFSDVLAAASSNANTNVSMMGETFKYVGSMAGALGYDIESVALMTGLMANSGVKGTMAGTALNSVISRLSTNTSGAADAISALGVEFYNSDGSARDLTTVMGELRRATAGMSAEEKSALANTVAGMEAQKGFLAILNASEEDYNKLSDAIYNADGAAQQMSETMLDNMQGSFTLLQSAVDGVKLSLGERLAPYLRSFADWLTSKMPAVEKGISAFMDKVDAKVDKLKATIREFTSSDEWASADIWGKLSIAWDKIIAEPFSEWWGSRGKPWLSDKIRGFGQALGSGITHGLLALLGLDLAGAAADGMSIGASFIQGFKQGFDVGEIGKAIMSWAGEHKGMAIAAGVLIGGYLLAGFARVFQGGKALVSIGRGLFDGGRGLFNKFFGRNRGTTATMPGSPANEIYGPAQYVTSTMQVTAGTVIVNGAVSNAANAARNFATRSAAGPALSLPETSVTGGRLALPAPSPAMPGAPLALPGGVGGGATTVLRNGTVLAGTGGAIKTGFATIGNALGSGATTLAGAAAAGAAATGGILAAGASLFSAAKDFYSATQATEKNEGNTSTASGLTKAGGVAAGALIGTAILPGIGTAVGAGIGGLAGWFTGNKMKEGYTKYTEDAEESARALALAEEQAKYGSKELKDALADTTVTAEEFAAMFREKVAESLTSHFGDLKLTAAEIDRVAKSITDLGDSSKITAFNRATQDAANSFQKIQQYAGSMDKVNWKIGLGMDLSTDELFGYRESLDGVFESVKEYVENSHYEATSAIELLVGEDSEFDFTRLNTAYETIQQELDAAGKEYTAAVDIALEDGEITANEQGMIQEAMDRVTEIADRISEIEVTANLKALDIKYSGAALDADSFSQLQEAIQQEVESATTAYDEALKVGITSLELQLQEGAIKPEEYDAQLQILTEAYHAKVSGLEVQVESFQLQAIADAYSTELDGILPNIEGTTAEKLGTALHNAIAAGVDVTTWDQATAAHWLGLEGLEQETQGAIYDRMLAVAQTLPSTMSEVFQNTADADMGSVTEPIAQNFVDAFQEHMKTDFDGADIIGGSLAEHMATEAQEFDFTATTAPVGQSIIDGIKESVTTALAGVDLLVEPITEAAASADMTGAMEPVGQSIAQGAVQSIAAALEGQDLIGSTLTTAVSTGAASLDATAALAPIGPNVASGAQGVLSSTDYSGAGTAVNTGIGAAISGADFGPIQEAINGVYTQTGAAINSTFAGGFDTSTSVRITIDWSLVNPTASISVPGGGSTTVTATLGTRRHARGGLIDGPEYSLIGEDGPEFVVPVGSKYHSRGLDLWKQAGAALGVLSAADEDLAGEMPPGEGPDGTGDGGNGAPVTTFTTTKPTDTGPYSAPQEPTVSVPVNIEVNPEIIIQSADGTTEEDIVRILRARIRDMVDDISDEMADRLARIFANMPLRGAS